MGLEALENKLFEVIKEYRANYSEDGMCLDNACKKVVGKDYKEIFIKVKDILDTKIEERMWRNKLGENWYDKVQNMMMASLEKINNKRKQYIQKVGKEFNNVVVF